MSLSNNPLTQRPCVFASCWTFAPAQRSSSLQGAKQPGVLPPDKVFVTTLPSVGPRWNCSCTRSISLETLKKESSDGHVLPLFIIWDLSAGRFYGFRNSRLKESTCQGETEEPFIQDTRMNNDFLLSRGGNDSV